VTLDVSAAQGPLQVRWLDVTRSEWRDPQTVKAGSKLELKPPGPGHWAVVATKVKE
jgi:hypothetical protein